MNIPEVKIQKQYSNENQPQRPGLLRLRQIVGDRANPGIIPISKSSWWQGVKTGRFPKPLHLGPRTTVWKSTDIDMLINRNGSNDEGGAR
jgi:prophage regulatory protein